MDGQRELSRADRAKLQELNATVDRAIFARAGWLDSKIAEYATIPIGQNLYDLHTGELLGVVREHVRQQDLPPELERDRYLEITYWYDPPGGGRFSTDRSGLRFGSRAERDARLQEKLAMPRDERDGVPTADADR